MCDLLPICGPSAVAAAAAAAAPAMKQALGEAALRQKQQLTAQMMHTPQPTP